MMINRSTFLPSPDRGRPRDQPHRRRRSVGDGRERGHIDHRDDMSKGARP
jgi:hypothetical protein